MNLRKITAIHAARAVSLISTRLLHRQGVTYAGSIALRICPDILRDLASQVRGDIFVVCGTNGKTTTNNLICAALESEGRKVVCNRTGSNMLAGVASAFVLSADIYGRLDADNACIEIDEASARRIFPHFRPDYMVLTNLFRDQLDRYGEIDTTMEMLLDAMRSAPDMKLIVNADDNLTAYLAEEAGNTCSTYGIRDRDRNDSEGRETRDGRFCKRCGALLKYRFYHYSQLGDYECTVCGFRRPAIDYNASDTDLSEGCSFTVEGRRLSAGFGGFYNVYNILAAYAAIRSSGSSAAGFRDMLAAYDPGNGRMEEFHIGDSRVVLNLAKNPTGFNQMISALMTDREDKDIIIAINDNGQDGRDVSWLWDVDFERLRDCGAGCIMVSGLRCYDMRLRLKYASIGSTAEPDIERALRSLLDRGSSCIWMLVNYTALYSTRDMLIRLGGNK